MDTLSVDAGSPKIMAHWEEIMNRINSGDMRPEDEPRPKPEEIATEYREGVDLDSVLSNSFGFGGTNATLVLSSYRG